MMIPSNLDELFADSVRRREQNERRERVQSALERLLTRALRESDRPRIALCERLLWGEG